MTDAELDQLLGPGVAGCELAALGPDGEVVVIPLDRHTLLSPVALRGALRRHLGHAVPIDPWDADEHDRLVRSLVRDPTPWPWRRGPHDRP